MGIFYTDDFKGWPKFYSKNATPIKKTSYANKNFVYTEAFYNGNLITLRQNQNGCFNDPISDMDFINGYHADKSHFNSFEVEINGMRLHDKFEFINQNISKTNEGFDKQVITLNFPMNNIQIDVVTIVDNTTFMTRYLEIVNNSSEKMYVTGLYPMCGMLYTEHLANTIKSEELRPTYKLGTYRDNYYLGEGEFEFLDMPKATLKFTHEHPMFNPPIYILKDDIENAYTYFSLETSMMTSAEFTKCGEYLWGRNVNNQDYIHFKLGVDKKATYREIKPGERLVSPKIHIGQMIGDLDDIVNEYYEHLRTSIIPSRKNKKMFNPVTYCCCAHDCCQIDEEYILNEIDKALAINADCMLMDAGWFGHGDKWWWQVRGDWFENELLNNNLKLVFDKAREKGLMVGLWAEIEAINFDSDLFKDHPNWAIEAYGKKIPNLNVLIPEAKQYIVDNLTRIIEYYNLDIFRIDGGLKEPSEMVVDNNIIETSWEYFDILYPAFEEIRKKHPNVYFENCSGGTGRCDLSIMKIFDWESLTDLFETNAHMKTLYGLSLAFAPEQIHSSTNYMNISKGNAKYSTRTSLCGHATLANMALNLEDTNAKYIDDIKKTVDLQKREINPIIGKSNLYHHTPFEPYVNKNSWMVLELSSIDKSKSIIEFFKMDGAKENTFKCIPRGIKASSSYNCYLDNDEVSFTISGYELLRDGLVINLYGNNVSEVVVLTEIK